MKCMISIHFRPLWMLLYFQCYINISFCQISLCCVVWSTKPMFVLSRQPTPGDLTLLRPSRLTHYKYRLPKCNLQMYCVPGHSMMLICITQMLLLSYYRYVCVYIYFFLSRFLLLRASGCWTSGRELHTLWGTLCLDVVKLLLLKFFFFKLFKNALLHYIFVFTKNQMTNCLQKNKWKKMCCSMNVRPLKAK